MKQKLQAFIDRHNSRPTYGLFRCLLFKDIMKKELNTWIQSREFNVEELSSEDIQELARLQDYYKPVTDKYFISALFYKPISNTEES